MGAEERQPVPDLKTAIEPFVANARRFSFFRLVYMLERIASNAPAVGQLAPASEDRILLRAHT